MLALVRYTDLWWQSTISLHSNIFRKYNTAGFVWDRTITSRTYFHHPLWWKKSENLFGKKNKSIKGTPNRNPIIMVVKQTQDANINKVEGRFNFCSVLIIILCFRGQCWKEWWTKEITTMMTFKFIKTKWRKKIK